MRKRFMKRMVGISLVAVLILGGCADAEREVLAPELKNPVGVEIDTAQVTKMDLSNETIYTGQIVPEIVEVAFEISGDIGEMKVSVGEKVKKGDLLATLSGSDAKETRENLQATLQATKSGFADENKVSQAGLDSLNEELKQLKRSYRKKKSKELKNQIITKQYDIRIQEKKMEQAKDIQSLEIEKQEKEIQKLSQTTGEKKLYAPIDGDVIHVIGGSGHMVQAGSAAVYLADMSSTRVKTEYISTTILNKASSYVAVVNGKEYEVEAEKVKVDRYAIETGIGIPTETNFDFNRKDISLQVGEFALIRLRNDMTKDALVVPANAVQKDSQGRYVYVKEGGSKVRREVTIGTATDAYIQLLTGVREGDVVYVES